MIAAKWNLRKGGGRLGKDNGRTALVAALGFRLEHGAYRGHLPQHHLASYRGGFDLSVLRRCCNEDDLLRTNWIREGNELDSALLSVSAMLDEAERVGRLDFLAAPRIQTPEQIVSMVNRRFGQEA